MVLFIYMYFVGLELASVLHSVQTVVYMYIHAVYLFHTTRHQSCITVPDCMAERKISH